MPGGFPLFCRRVGEPEPDKQPAYRDKVAGWGPEQFALCWTITVSQMVREFPSRFRHNAAKWDWQQMANSYDEMDRLAHHRVRAEVYADTCGLLADLARDGLPATEECDSGKLADGQRKPQAGKLPVLQPHDKKAHQLSLLDGWKQQRIVDELNKEYGTTYSQGQVSRMIKRAKEHAKASGLSALIPEPAKPPKTINPRRLELGQRTDHRVAGQRSKFTSNI